MNGVILALTALGMGTSVAMFATGWIRRRPAMLLAADLIGALSYASYAAFNAIHGSAMLLIFALVVASIEMIDAVTRLLRRRRS